MIALPATACPAPPTISVVIPTLNEAAGIADTLAALRGMAGLTEVLVVDGGSTDATCDLAVRGGARVLASDRGRGTQMHVGALAASGEVLWFLHADTLPPAGAAEAIWSALADPRVVGGGFSVRFTGESRAARFFTAAYPWMARAGLLYGDAALFSRAAAYHEIGGFAPYPVFEDLHFVRRLARHGRLACAPGPVITSSRRFEGRGGVGIVAQWSALHLLYAAGVSPQFLGRLYRPVRKAGARADRRDPAANGR